jgi:hypothetical protein
MLAFNLGIFFRNLKGTEVDFAARSTTCTIHFTGQVQALADQMDLTRRLTVTLRSNDLVCLISFDEGEGDESEEPQEEGLVEVRLVDRLPGGERLLVESTFRFEDISLKPHQAPEPPQDPAQAA